MINTWASSGSSLRTLSIFATWAASSQTMTLAPELPTTHAHSSGEFDGYTGTTIAPSVDTARSATVNSTRVLARMHTRSPTSTPRPISPKARSRTCSHSSLKLSSAHSPSRRNIAALASP